MSWKAVMSLAAALLLFTASGAAEELPKDRIGFAEEFDSLDGWKMIDPFEKTYVKNGVAVFDTWVGSFMGAKPDEQPVAVGACADSEKTYDQEVDFDKYHYIVTKIDAKNMYTLLYVNDKEVQASYSTGVVAQDLAPLGVTGKQKVKLHFEIMNTNGEFKVDYIRLVSALSDEEKKGLIAAPVKLYHQEVPTHSYQRLEALCARAARPRRALAEETVAFRDVGTGAPMWRVTQSPADEGFSENYDMWLPDGSGFYVLTGRMETFLYDQGQFVRKSYNDLVPAKYQVNFYTRRGWVQFMRWNPDAKKYDVIHEFERKGEGRSAEVAGDRLVAMDSDLCVVDASKEPPAVRHFPVPSVNAKGFGVTPDNRWARWFSPFGAYRTYCVNLDSGEVRQGGVLTFTHGMSGSPWSIMSYGSIAKLQVNEMANEPGNTAPGGLLKVHGVYLDPVETDYGGMTTDDRYGITNGIGGELNHQYVMFDREDPGTVVRLCTYRVSKVDWYVWTKAIASPDYTKLGHVSDILGNSDYYMCIMRTPDAPRELKAEKVPGGVKLAWQPPTRAREIKGYSVYRSEKSGLNFARVNRDLVAKTEFVDANAPAAAFYLVAAQEHSGLEGYFSNEASIGADASSVVLHFEAEEGTFTRPMRLVLDGAASGNYAVRVTPVAAGEGQGMLSVPVRLPAKRRLVPWMRCVNPKGEGGPKVAEWKWEKLGGVVEVGPGADHKMACEFDGAAIDKVILTDDGNYVPHGLDDRKAPPAPVTGLKVVEAKPNEIAIAWDAHPALDLAYYSIYVGDRPGFALGNESVLASGHKTTACDWGIKPGATYYYKVVAVDRRGQSSAPAALEAKTPPMTVVTKELAVADAKVTEKLTRGKAEGLDLAYVAHLAGAGDQKCAFEFDVPQAGDYYLWAEYSPRSASARVLAFELDGAEFGNWTTHQVGRLGQDPKQPIAPGKERWLVERVVAGKGRYQNKPSDFMTLAAGRHALAVVFAGANAGKTPWLSKLWLSNDASFVPPGYSPQFRFNSLRRQR